MVQHVHIKSSNSLSLQHETELNSRNWMAKRQVLIDMNVLTWTKQNTYICYSRCMIWIFCYNISLTCFKSTSSLYHCYTKVLLFIFVYSFFLWIIFKYIMMCFFIDKICYDVLITRLPYSNLQNRSESFFKYYQ